MSYSSAIRISTLASLWLDYPGLELGESIAVNPAHPGVAITLLHTSGQQLLQIVSLESLLMLMVLGP